MAFLALDPGPEKTAFVLWGSGIVLDKGHLANAEVLSRLYDWAADRDGAFDTGRTPPDRMFVEMIASYGMPVGKEVFETCLWIGRFIEGWQGHYRLVYRKDVKLDLCGSARAKDSNIRQAILDRFGGKDTAVGRKKNPGPLYGVSGDVWAALAVAVHVDNRDGLTGGRTPPTTQE